MRTRRALAVALLGIAALIPSRADAHPLGNFSISHYAGIKIDVQGIELRYLIDMAEIPTFQEIQESGIVPEAGHPTLKGYLAKKAEGLKNGLFLEISDQRLPLQARATEVIFPPGAGGLPTMKLGIVYRVKLDGAATVMDLRYKDVNFEGRAGWKEIVASGGPGIAFASSSVPDRDKSRELSDYPTNLFDSPPQDLEARVVFALESRPAPVTVAASLESSPQPARPEAGPNVRGEIGPVNPNAPLLKDVPAEAVVGPLSVREPIRLEANRQPTPRSSFTELVITKEWGIGIVLMAMAVAVGLGAVHALEPGHGKTAVAAYLVGSRGTARHALVLGLTVTASHTAGVYLLGGVTLYASRYVVPEHLYPWFGVFSGLTIAALGFVLFLSRYAGKAHPHLHDHPHDDHVHHRGSAPHAHGPDEHSHGASHHDHSRGGVSLKELFVLGITGGIVPCPAALVVLLAALSAHRVGFGLLLIVAFSMGLAAVLIAIGLLMVYARRVMSRFRGDGPLLTRWLPLTSSALITVFGVSVAFQALKSAGILQIRF